MIFGAASTNLRIKIVVTNLFGSVDPVTDEVTLNQVGFVLLVGDQ
jgi:hypothetical protein